MALAAAPDQLPGGPHTSSPDAAGPLLDVRHSHLGSHGSPDEEVKDIYAYGAGLHSTNAIVGLSDFTNLQTLSLHGNQIERIEGLEVLHQLVTLNLSSNSITWMEGLSQLKKLRVLNLSNNRIREIAGLQGLVALKTLILSHNEISLLGGLSVLQGLPYALQHLDLRDNVVEYLCELWILGGCSHLEEVIFQCGGYANPVCTASAYRSTLLSVVPRLQSLDGSSCVGQAPLLNTDMLSGVPSLWAIHHSYPGLRNPVDAGPKILRPSVENQNYFSCRPTIVLQDADSEATGRFLSDGSHSEPIHFGYSGVFQGNARGCKPQDQLQRPDSRYISNHKSPRRKSDTYQGRHCMQRTHELSTSNYQIQATREHDHSGDDCAKPDCNSHHIIVPKYFQQGARGSAHPNDENLIDEDALMEDSDASLWKESSKREAAMPRKPGMPILDFENQHADEFHGKRVSCNAHPWNKTNDNEELDISFTEAAATDNSRAIGARVIYFQIAPEHQDKKTQTTRELATQTESVTGPISDQVSQEANRLQSNLSTITVVIDGNSSYTGIGKQNVLELYKKDNELLYLTKEKKILEDELTAFKKLVDHERSDWHVDDNYKSMVLRSLKNLKGCKLELNNLRKTVTQTEKELITEVKHVESSIIKHIVLDDAIKLSALSAETLALKEALNSALDTCQTVGTALNDANHQKEKAKRTLVSLTAALDEQRSKVKIVTEMLENCTHQERRSRRECNRLKSELDMVCQVLRKNKDRETEDLIWQARGREEAEKLSQQWADELHRRLVVTQTLICQALQENAKTLSSVSKLRDMMLEKMLELRNAFEAVTEKERGAKELITELSFVVSAQKKRSEWMQLELDRLATSKQAVHEEVERLQAEVFRLQERSSATEQKAMEAEALRRELANVTSTAERERRSVEEAACARFSSLLLENEKLAARASSLAHKFQETQNIIMAKTEVCGSQEAIIQQLKDELLEAKNVACVSEANIRVLEADLVQRLQYEVEQKYELHNELTLQETIISKMEEELKISKTAKYGAEQACKSLQEKVNDVDLLLRHVDEEINGVKNLYEGREKTISLEKDDALAKVTTMQKKLEDAEVATKVAMQAHFESTKLMEAKEQKLNTNLIQKDILIEDLKKKVKEVEEELHSHNLALEIQKAISSAKVEQLGKVLEELREVT